MDSRNRETLKHVIKSIIEEDYTHSEEADKKFVSEIGEAVAALGGVDNELNADGVKEALSKYPDNGILQKINKVAENNTTDDFDMHEEENNIYYLEIDGDDMDFNSVSVVDFDTDEENDGFDSFLTLAFEFEDTVEGMGGVDSGGHGDPQDAVDVYADFEVVATYEVNMLGDYSFQEEDYDSEYDDYEEPWDEPDWI